MLLKIQLKKLNIDNYPCKPCKNYIHGVGYIQGRVEEGPTGGCKGGICHPGWTAEKIF